MVQPRVTGKIQYRSAGARFRIFGREHEARNPCENHGAETHGAGFEGYVESRVDQSPPPERLGSLSDHNHLRMGSRILPAFSEIMGLSQDSAVMHKESADRDFPQGRSAGRLLKRSTHEWRQSEVVAGSIIAPPVVARFLSGVKLMGGARLGARGRAGEKRTQEGSPTR